MCINGLYAKKLSSTINFIDGWEANGKSLAITCNGKDGTVKLSTFFFLYWYNHFESDFTIELIIKLNLIYVLHNFFSVFFYSLDVFSLFHRLFLNNTELKIFGRHRGCHSSVAERLCAIQAVLGSIPGGDQIF